MSMYGIINVLMTILFSMLMAVGQISLSFASKQIFSSEKVGLLQIITNKWLFIGISIYILSLGIWIYILSRFDIKYAYPIASSAIFYVAVFQSILNREYPPLNYWIGLVLVVTGLIVLTLGKKI
jgi:undecaprenyl phosphate-alpha-L-ara4N flippase subunit ArnE